jgi:hypothetical protein
MTVENQDQLKPDQNVTLGEDGKPIKPVTGQEGGAGTDDPGSEEAVGQFSTGFNRIRGEHQELGEKPTGAADEGGADKGKQAGNEQQAGQEPEAVKTLQKRLRKVEGQFGEVNKRLGEIASAIQSNKAGDATAKQTQEQAQATLHNLQELEQSVGQFKELTPFLEELKSISKTMDELKAAPATKQTQDQAAQASLDVSEIALQVQRNLEHPKWQEETQTPEFVGFMLQGGPKKEVFDAWAQMNAVNPEQAAEVVEDWQIDHPQWWKTMGQHLFSEKTADQLHVLNAFKAHKGAKTQGDQQQSRTQRRLAGAMDPNTVSADPPQGKNEQEQFASGFKRVAAQRQHK